ncbi:glycosyltransferase [Afifella aestuarii]|uniref:glycosyltransferase n=1 Tax=Afifella aestuarii TaxID=1909496 RepID=UPI000FE2BA58|nr:glycosyltransferase [Afifella aestuarii]
MAQLIDSNHHASLSDYERIAHLSNDVRDLRDEAEMLLPKLQGRRVWMVNSTAHGGGVAELLPPLITMLRELGVDANWLVMESDEDEFFRLTKQIHNLIHGAGDPDLGNGAQALYEKVSHSVAARLAEFVKPNDVLVIHDPQPLGAGALLRERMDLTAIWRCHIGLDEETPETIAAWEFLEQWAVKYDHTVFTAPEYIPRCLAGRASIIHPSIDPLSNKNRDLPVHKLAGILANGGLITATGPTLTPPFEERAQRLQRNGEWAPATEPEDLGLLFRPIVTQVSRWDRLKGWLPLMQGFVKMKEALKANTLSEEERRPLELARLVLAGPDPESVTDDPEGLEALQEVIDTYLSLDADLQNAIAVISLPMTSPKNNALIVNALQRCSDIVVQNSVREGFGLTVTEAMWKRAAIVGSPAAGLRQQIRPDLDGRLVKDAHDTDDIARTLTELLLDQEHRDAFGLSAQQRVHNEFLVFAHVRNWLRVLAETLDGRAAAA